MVKLELLNGEKRKIEKESKKFYARLKRRPPPGIDAEVSLLDAKVFAGFDCLVVPIVVKPSVPYLKTGISTGSRLIFASLPENLQTPIC